MPAKPKLRALTVRKLPSEDYDWLRRQAAAHGRSMEAEIRALLLTAKRRSKDAGLSTRTRAEKVKLPAEKLPVEDVTARLQSLFKDVKPKRKSKLLSEEFMEERRRMWGEE